MTRSAAVPKKQTPKDDTIWDAGNPRPLLRLITCDPTTPVKGGHYVGNWVVWAVPGPEPRLRGAVAGVVVVLVGRVDAAPALGHEPGGREGHPGHDEARRAAAAGPGSPRARGR